MLVYFNGEVFGKVGKCTNFIHFLLSYMLKKMF